MELEHVAVIVEDYDTAIAFYVDVLGFDLVTDEPSTTNDGRPKRWVVVRPPGARTGLLLAQADGPEQRTAVGRQFAGRVGLFLRVEDFAAQYARMTAAGVEFVTEPRTEAYGAVAVFLDVCGNRWDLLGPAPALAPATATRERRNTRPRDALGRPLPYGSAGVPDLPEGVVRTPHESLAEAYRLLEQGRPFHAHEVLEDAWKSCPTDERDLWQGLAQLAVGVTHVARGNRVGGVRLIGRGASNLGPFASAPRHGLDIAAVLAWASTTTARLAAGADVELDPPPLLPAADA